MSDASAFLGKYVVVKQRSDGTHAVYFHVPKPLRPIGWRPTINLPLDPPRTGHLSDMVEVDRIKADASTLFGSMHRERLAQMRSRAIAARAQEKGPDA